MSYCRFSCERFRSDVYVYEAESGYVTHVAGQRYRGAPPPGATLTDLMAAMAGGDAAIEAALEAYRRGQAWFDWVPRVRIDLPEAGENFEHDTPGECAANLRRLRAIGFHVPQYALDQLEEEATEDQ